MKPSPPKYPLRFLRWFCREDYLDEIEGDLLELFEKRVEKSARRARWRFAWDVVKSFRIRNIKSISSQNSSYTAMFQHYFKISWRSLLKNKGYSLINIGGLSVGMAVAVLIGLWVYDELSYNKYHDNYESIAKLYRINDWPEGTEAGSVLTPGLAHVLREDYDLFDKVVLVRAGAEERIIAFGEKKFTQRGYFMQNGGPEMLTLDMKYGNWDGLKDMNSILLSASLAQKLFGDDNPVGKLVTMDAGNSLKVAGVYKDLPKNSEFHEASYFAPIELYVNGWTTLNVWDNYFMNIYVQIKPTTHFQLASVAIKDAMLPHVDQENLATNPRLFLQPMRKWRLYSQFEGGVPETSQRLKAVWYNGTIGIFVLLLACINFMNLSTARSEKRAKEVGILKAIGSHRRQLIQQFFSESMLVTLLASVAALLFVSLSLPWFNNVADKNIALPLTSPVFWALCVGFTMLTGLVAGSYPALYLSSLKPVKVLKGTFKAGRLAALPRKVLVVLQFTVSISLIIGTLVVYQQLQHAKNRPVGYSRDGLISLRSASPEYRGKYMLLRNELRETGVVEEIAESNYAVTDTRGWNGGFVWNGRKYDYSFNTIFVTHEYGKTVGLEFVEGRDFSRELASDRTGILINESALELFGIENPVGETLSWYDRGNFTILGVVKDMVKGSPYEPTDPSVLFLSENDLRWLYIRIKPEISAHEALPKIQEVFSRLIPSAPFDYRFADDEYAAKFREEERIGSLASVFAALTIFISCLGLFGLAAFTAEQRTKEIGIRKVLGASVVSLWRMLSKDFLELVIISCFIALPASCYFMSGWLDNYPYHTGIRWYVLVLTGLGALLITLLTVSYQAIKAATSNPVKSLRAE